MRKFFILALLLLVPFAYSASIEELIAKYSFEVSNGNFNITSVFDNMIDNDNNGLHDQLVFTVDTRNVAGDYAIELLLYTENGIVSNHSKVALQQGPNSFDISISTKHLSGNKFNYSLFVYNDQEILWVRKDSLTTNEYDNYEKGFIINLVTDYIENSSINLNVDIESWVEGSYEVIAYLEYGNSFITLNEEKQISKGVQQITLTLDDEKIRKTHYIGRYKLTALKIGDIKINTEHITYEYDYRQFSSLFAAGFSEKTIDSDDNGRFDIFSVLVNISALQEGDYEIEYSLYDSFNGLVQKKKLNAFLYNGLNPVELNFDCPVVYMSKLDGPYKLKSLKISKNGNLIESISNAFATQGHYFSDFEAPDLPDLTLEVLHSPDPDYGNNEYTAELIVKNNGTKPAFNVFFEFFDNSTLNISNMTSILMPGAQLSFQRRYINADDIEIIGFVDWNDIIEESDETNNAVKNIIKINKKPEISQIEDITINETQKLILKVNAIDDDKLQYSSNFSKMIVEDDIFSWQTGTIDSGAYDIRISVTDGFLNDSFIFTITVIDMPELDADNDGILDTEDRLIGDVNSISTNIENLGLLISDSDDLKRIFDSNEKIEFFDDENRLIEFSFDFSSRTLDLRNVRLFKQTDDVGSLHIAGLEDLNKTIYVDRLKEFDGVCIKDSEISGIGDISQNCNDEFEHRVNCNSTVQTGYLCSILPMTNRIVIENVVNSGIIQFNYTKWKLECVSNWQCTNWSSCSNSTRTRTCADMNRCEIPNNTPQIKESCKSSNPLVELIRKIISIIFRWLRR